MASWTVQVGDLDQCVHLWRHTGGFEKIDLTERNLKLDSVSLIIFKIILINFYAFRIMFH